MLKKEFGKTKDGITVYKYEMENKNGVKAVVTNYGAILVNLFVPDQNGKIDDVVMGFDTVEGYESNPPFFGSTIAPSANRIDKASFEIDGVEYKLKKNDGDNNLHSDEEKGAHKRVWNAEEGENFVKFVLKMNDMDLGFPGNKTLTVTYTLTEDNELKISYCGSSDKKTLFNPTNHSYFNLAGHGYKTAMDHVLTLNADRFSEVREGLIPTGNLPLVKGTVMDFTSPKRIGEEIDTDTEQLRITGGYDHNWVINDYDGSVKYFATLKDPKSGRVLKAYTNLPGVQFYAGNFIDEITGKEGLKYGYRGAVCLETQYFPNSINEPSFTSPVFGPENPYKSETIYKFEF